MVIWILLQNDGLSYAEKLTSLSHYTYVDIYIQSHCSRKQLLLSSFSIHNVRNLFLLCSACTNFNWWSFLFITSMMLTRKNWKWFYSRQLLHALVSDRNTRHCCVRLGPNVAAAKLQRKNVWHDTTCNVDETADCWLFYWLRSVSCSIAFSNKYVLMSQK